jgi:hypothetical protein
VGKVKRFSSKMLYHIEDLKMTGHSIQHIAKTLKITAADVRKGLIKIYADEISAELQGEKKI